eukprot:119050-Chlamydomonas_euryale.AAC.1
MNASCCCGGHDSGRRSRVPPVNLPVGVWELLDARHLFELAQQRCGFACSFQEPTAGSWQGQALGLRAQQMRISWQGQGLASEIMKRRYPLRRCSLQTWDVWNSSREHRVGAIAKELTHAGYALCAPGRGTPDPPAGVRHGGLTSRLQPADTSWLVLARQNWVRGTARDMAWHGRPTRGAVDKTRADNC